ncbi:type VI secretion system protein TssL, long form [Ralstonia sp. UBA689]|uniref:type VI secretion system protein TssL, long form n=1 Tax=Ralstonia sp. UBA689 TaxID=1947373 RepID=UPI0025EF1EAE|nr:type VI secretion system protein TssL, long form [Ralstonia sp. UBA689]
MNKRATPAPASSPEEEDFEQRLAAVRQAENPLLEASRVLLRAQADMPGQLGPDGVLRLHEMLAQEVRTFDKLGTQANIRRDHMIGASYCLCTALDEAAMQADWAKDRMLAGEWGQKSLASTFHRDVAGGEKVYALIGRLLDEPEEHRDLLEVIYRVLSTGFEGQFRRRAHGQRQHMAVRTRIYAEIMHGRDAVPIVLSPHSAPYPEKQRRWLWDIPVWYAVVMYAVILLALFGYYKYRLSMQADGMQKQLADIAHMTPPPAPPALHLKELLKAEIAAGTVSVDEDASRSAVTFGGDSMFQAGGAGVNAAMNPLIAKIASEVAKVPGKVTVAGYTDNIPIKSRQFASNQALSQGRAPQVMQMLQTAGVPGSRLEAVGKGDADPIGDNRTAKGRAQNRRVEIAVARRD